MLQQQDYAGIANLPEVLDFSSDRDRQLLLDEACSRMRELKMSENAIGALYDSNGAEVWMSEGMGALYSIDDNVGDDYVLDILARIRDKELFPYHVIHDLTNIGELFSVLVISKYTEEWPLDREEIPNGIVLANVYNKNYGLDDLGSIRVRPVIGGLVREA